VTDRRLIGAVAALVVAAALAGCQSPVESPAALLVTSGGSVLRLDDACALGPLTGAPENIRHLAVAGLSIVVISEAGQVSVARATGLSADGLTWRKLRLAPPRAGSQPASTSLRTADRSPSSRPTTTPIGSSSWSSTSRAGLRPPA
jgi:hypothetical protein